MDEGAFELDMVLNIGQLRSGKNNYVRADIKAVCDVAHGLTAFIGAQESFLLRDQRIQVIPGLGLGKTQRVMDWSSDGSKSKLDKIPVAFVARGARGVVLSRWSQRGLPRYVQVTL